MKKQIKIGIFYDGNYFRHVNNYYQYTKKQWINLKKFHEFIQDTVAKEKYIKPESCQILSKHCFMGEHSIMDVPISQIAKQRCFKEYLEEEITVNALKLIKMIKEEGEMVRVRFKEDAVDTKFVLETIRIVEENKLDVVALICGDSDFTSLIQDLKDKKKKTILFFWNLFYKDKNEKEQTTTTSKKLLKEVDYRIPMHTIIDEPTSQYDEIKSQLLCESKFMKSFSDEKKDNANNKKDNVIKIYDKHKQKVFIKKEKI